MEGVILDDIDEEEDNSWNNQISGRNCVVFLIDSRTEMFKKTKGTSYFLQSLIVSSWFYKN